jgi:hypothetical protein
LGYGHSDRRGAEVGGIETIMGHPELQGLRRFMLVTRDAAGLYRKFEFETPEEPNGIMHIRWRDRYNR